MSTALDVAQIVSAIAALGAAAVAGWQIRSLRHEAFAARAAEIHGVCVVTKVVHRPVETDSSALDWQYRFTVNNPGRFPITGIEVQVRFPVEVRRKHYNEAIDDGADVLVMNVPVISANGSHSWERTVRIPHIQDQELRSTKASVSFTAPDAGRRTNLWPEDPQHREPARGLRRALSAS